MLITILFLDLVLRGVDSNFQQNLHSLLSEVDDAVVGFWPGLGGYLGLTALLEKTGRGTCALWAVGVARWCQDLGPDESRWLLAACPELCPTWAPFPGGPSHGESQAEGGLVPYGPGWPRGSCGLGPGSKEQLNQATPLGPPTSG